MARLVLNQLTRSFGDVTAVDRISLDVADGDFLVLLGPSGCGKTTLLRMIAGLLEPTGGSIEIDGTDITGLPARKRDLAMVFQSYALYPHLSVAKNLAFPLRVRGTAKSEITERVRVAAESVEIGHLLDRKPKELSGDSVNASPWPGRWYASHRPSSWTSRYRTSTRNCALPPGRNSRRCTARSGPLLSMSLTIRLRP